MARPYLLAEIVYPDSDGKPMAETPLHLRVIIEIIETLIAWFGSDPLVYVWGNMFLYYVEGDTTKNVSPDVMVVKGVSKDKPRDTYKVWEEGKTPNAMIEVTSKKTRKEDVGKKFRLYQDILKVQEYFLFDPRGEYLDPPLKGYRLVKGKYQPIQEVDGRLPSRVLKLHLEPHGQDLRLYDPETGKWLPNLIEVREAALQAEEARAAAQAAEAEVERLRRELEFHRRQRSES